MYFPRGRKIDGRLLYDHLSITVGIVGGGFFGQFDIISILLFINVYIVCLKM